METSRLMMLLERKLDDGEYENAAHLASALANLEKAELLKSIREGSIILTSQLTGQTKITISHANA